MKLSILDQVPLTEHTPTPAEAVTSGLRLVHVAEELGFHRIWLAEHHHSRSFASAAPEMMTALTLERTNTIRVGTGGILLPLYPVRKVVEVMSLLRHAHGDRVDTGVGRAALDLGHDGPIPSAETAARHDWMDQERTRAKARSQANIAGTLDRVHRRLVELVEAHGADEIMINTLTSDPDDRLNSYRLLAQRFTS